MKLRGMMGPVEMCPACNKDKYVHPARTCHIFLLSHILDRLKQALWSQQDTLLHSSNINAGSRSQCTVPGCRGQGGRRTSFSRDCRCNMDCRPTRLRSPCCNYCTGNGSLLPLIVPYRTNNSKARAVLIVLVVPHR